MDAKTVGDFFAALAVELESERGACVELARKQGGAADGVAARMVQYHLRQAWKFSRDVVAETSAAPAAGAATDGN